MRQPIIFIGMHRSGTSLLGRLLEQLGIFVGVKKDRNNESTFFQALNEWFLKQSGGRWDNPRIVDELLLDEETLTLIEEFVRARLRGPSVAEYLGWYRYLRHRTISERLDFPWGWKDPRNTFTLPIWLRLFPDARVIYIERHGVDVAHSLVERRSRGLADTVQRYRRYKSLYISRLKERGFSESVRCGTHSGAFDLWVEYVERGRQHVSDLGARCLSLSYEELLREPLQPLLEVAEFAGLDGVTAAAIEHVASSIRSSRSYAYQQDRQLRAFACERSEQLRRFGYEP